MINLQNKKRSDYQKDGDLPALEEVTKDYWDKSRTRETNAIEDLEKYLWLANAAAVTVSIGYLQKADSISCFQYCGAWSFIIGILMLITMKYVSAINSSRVRHLFQGAKSKFDADEASDYIFKDIRKDRFFSILRKLYLCLQYGAGLAFVGGCVLTLLGVTIGRK
jgi:hypothetical protein